LFLYSFYLSNYASVQHYSLHKPSKMKNLKGLLTVALCLFIGTAFSQGKSADIIKGINVYFPNSEVGADHKLNLNVQGTIVAIPLCHVDIAKVDDHNFSFTSKDKDGKMMRGNDATTSVKLMLVHSSADKFVGLLTSLQSAECGK